jgi:RNA-binding protein
LVQIGRHGLTDQALASIDRTLDAHELIKIKFLDFQDEKHALSDTIAERLDTVLIGIVGNVATFYRQQRDPDKRKITLPAPSHD